MRTHREWREPVAALRRTVSVSAAAMGLVIVASCGGQDLSVGQNGESAIGHQDRLAECTRTITQADEVSAALGTPFPGTTLCFTGGDLGGTDITLTRSGSADTPIRLLSDGATLRSISVLADHVIVEGFTVSGGDGIFLSGTDLTIRGNTVHDSRRGGITCDPCENSIIEGNTVRQVDTVGIRASGQRIQVSHNTISGTVARHNGDADGIRFFGNGHRITSNTITDISAEGYANPPHPDCFQTYDDGSPPTFDVLITGNTCSNVASQCLIATGDQRGNSGVPAGVPSITFADNICASGGAQAVNIRRWPGVEIRNNKISGPNVKHGIIVTDGSTGAVVTGNTTDGGRPTVTIDRSSQPGSRAEHNNPT